jgi:hypothetical protein
VDQRRHHLPQRPEEPCTARLAPRGVHDDLRRVLAGVDVTSAGNYNGGLENYPRFHEDWSRAAANPQPTLSYRGSFVSLSTPAHASGAWCGTGTTCKHLQSWDYDSLFNDVAMLPPLTPRFVAVQQTVLTEDFRKQSAKGTGAHGVGEGRRCGRRRVRTPTTLVDSARADRSPPIGCLTRPGGFFDE